MPKTQLRETYQQWSARKLEEELREFYKDSLTYHPKQRNYPQPDFELNTLYSESTKKSIPASVEQISVAVERCDVDSFKKLMGPSLVPSQILHHQKTQQRYWTWLQLNRSLLFFLRAEYLFWGAQKKFFYEELLDKVKLVEEVRITNPDTGKAAIRRRPSNYGLHFIKKYNETILPACFSASQLQIDIFWGKLHDKDNHDVKKFLDFLTQHKNISHFRNKAFRAKASSATRYPVAAIMKTQLLSVSEKDVTSCIRKNDAAFLMEIYRRYLTTIEPKQQRHFTHWLNTLLERKIDVATIGKNIQNTINNYIDHCDALLESQREAAAELIETEKDILENFYDAPIKESGIANLSLRDPRFNVVDKSKKTIVPMLHFAMRVYADAIEKDDILKAFKIIMLLIARGASPFQQLEITPFDIDKTTSESAFEYANLQPNWEILGYSLSYTLTYSPFAEKLRISLEKYSHENAAAPNAWQKRIFQSKKKLEERLSFVSHLTTLLQTGDKITDTPLLKAINNIIKNHTSHFANSKLHRLLKNILNDSELIRATRSDEMEMEMHTLELNEEKHESPPASPQPHPLFFKSFFSNQMRYSRLEEIKEDVTDDLELEDDSEISETKEEEIGDLEFNEERSHSLSI